MKNIIKTNFIKLTDKNLQTIKGGAIRVIKKPIDLADIHELPDGSGSDCSGD